MHIRRCAAARPCAAAVDALDAILDPRLHFAHANGGVDDKCLYLTKMASGRIDYTAIHWSEDVVTPLADDVAMLTGRMETAVTVEGNAKLLKNRVISVWGRSAGKWRQIAFQSTPLAA